MHKTAIDLSQIGKDDFKEPYYRVDDLKLEDLKEDDYVDPYYKLRRPIEPERLKIIYQQAYIYDLLYKFAKEYLPDIEDANKNVKQANESKKNDDANDKATDTTIDTIKQKVLDYLFRNKIDTNDDENEINKKPNLEDELNETNIWNIDDMKILRRNFSNIKETNILLKSKLISVEEENKRLKENLEKVNLELKTNRNEKLTLEQENERMYIRIQDLESRYEVYNKEMQQVDKYMKEMNDKLNQFKICNQDLTTDKLKLEFEINKQEQKLKLIKNELNLYYSDLVEKLKLKHKKEIKIYQEKLEEITNKYEELKFKNEKSQKALEHLRVHFMNSCVPPTPPTSKTNDKINEKLIKFL